MSLLRIRVIKNASSLVPSLHSFNSQMNQMDIETIEEV